MSADETAAVCAEWREILEANEPFCEQAALALISLGRHRIESLRHLLRCAEAWEAIRSRDVQVTLAHTGDWASIRRGSSKPYFAPTPLAAVLSALDAQEGE